MVFSKRQGLVTDRKKEEIARTIAQRNAMERSAVFLPHGSRLFEVEAGWESLMLMKAEGTMRCDTLSMLEAGLRNPDVRSLFVPLKALMTVDDIEKICRRNGAAKTIFKETGEKA